MWDTDRMVFVLNLLKYKLLLIVFAVLTFMSSFAQTPENVVERTPQQEADKLTDVMTRTLNLTEQQVPLVYGINLKYALLRRDTHDRSQALQNRQKKYQELQTVLTPHQYEILLMHHQQSRQPAAKQATIHLASPQPQR